MKEIHPPPLFFFKHDRTDVAGFCYKTIVSVVYISVQTIIKLHINQIMTTRLNKLINQRRPTNKPRIDNAFRCCVALFEYTRTAMNAVASFRFIFWPFSSKSNNWCPVNQRHHPSQ